MAILFHRSRGILAVVLLSAGVPERVVQLVERLRRRIRQTFAPSWDSDPVKA